AKYGGTPAVGSATGNLRFHLAGSFVGKSCRGSAGPRRRRCVLHRRRTDAIDTVQAAYKREPREQNDSQEDTRRRGHVAIGGDMRPGSGSRRTPDPGAIEERTPGENGEVDFHLFQAGAAAAAASPSSDGQASAGAAAASSSSNGPAGARAARATAAGEDAAQPGRLVSAATAGCAGWQACAGGEGARGAGRGRAVAYPSRCPGPGGAKPKRWRANRRRQISAIVTAPALGGGSFPAKGAAGVAAERARQRAHSRGPLPI